MKWQTIKYIVVIEDDGWGGGKSEHLTHIKPSKMINGSEDS